MSAIHKIHDAFLRCVRRRPAPTALCCANANMTSHRPRGNQIPNQGSYPISMARVELQGAPVVPAPSCICAGRGCPPSAPTVTFGIRHCVVLPHLVAAGRIQGMWRPGAWDRHNDDQGSRRCADSPSPKLSGLPGGIKRGPTGEAITATRSIHGRDLARAPANYRDLATGALAHDPSADRRRRPIS